jgi:predicted ATP-dependent serine protease
MQSSKTYGYCATCHRYTALTQHHLIPKKTHKRIAKSIPKKSLEETIAICRVCHDGIHDFYDERTLSDSYDTLEKLVNDDRLKRHFAWVAKLKKGIC